MSTSAVSYHLTFGPPGDELDAHGMPMQRSIRLHPTFHAVLLALLDRDRQGKFFSGDPLIVRYGVHPDRGGLYTDDGTFVVRLGTDSTEYEEAHRGNYRGRHRQARGLLEYKGHIALDEAALRGWSELAVPSQWDEAAIERGSSELFQKPAHPNLLFLKLALGDKVKGVTVGETLWALVGKLPEFPVVLVRCFSMEGSGLEDMRLLMKGNRGLKWRFPRSVRREMHKAAVALGVGIQKGREEAGWTEVDWVLEGEG